MNSLGDVLSAREQSVRRYFNMWLERSCSGIESVFSKDVVYIESDGKEYHGTTQLVRWFSDWHAHGSVESWEITAFSHAGSKCFAEWYFECVYDGNRAGFDGVTIAEFSADCRICMLREFAAAHEHSLPYGD